MYVGHVSSHFHHSQVYLITANIAPRTLNALKAAPHLTAAQPLWIIGQQHMINNCFVVRYALKHLNGDQVCRGIKRIAILRYEQL